MALIPVPSKQLEESMTESLKKYALEPAYRKENLAAAKDKTQAKLHIADFFSL
jgi:hypothetical protein